MTRVRGAVLFVVVTLAACRAPPPEPAAPPSAPPSAKDAPAAWPEADRLFRGDPAWRGGDAALSIDLGGDRILWLFGDSFVAKGSTASSRRDCAMVRNSVAIQQGRDPSTATMTFAHVRDAGGPRSFFPEDGDRWFWPNHGVRLGDAVYVFLARIVSAPGDGLGFAADGWELARLRGLDRAPEAWSLERLGAVATPFRTVVGAAVVHEDGHVVATAVDEPGDHSVRLVRWVDADLAAGALDRAEWWDGAAWTRGAPRSAVVAAEVSTEMSLSRANSGEWLLVHSRGFGASDVVARRASRLEGPYGAPEVIGRPPESDGPRPFVYAGKAHPELAGADLVVTYATNALDFGELVANESLYYPRFLRLSL